MNKYQLVYNSVTCLQCGEELVSYNRHDYKTCLCPNETMVDGGVSYSRYGGKNMLLVNPFMVYDYDPFEIVREYAYRGGRGINGDEPLTYTKLKDINDDWLDAIIDYGGPIWHIELIKKEILYRHGNKIIVK